MDVQYRTDILSSRPIKTQLNIKVTCTEESVPYQTATLADAFYRGGNFSWRLTAFLRNSNGSKNPYQPKRTNPQKGQASFGSHARSKPYAVL